MKLNKEKFKNFKSTMLYKYFKHNFTDSIYSILNLLVASLDGFFLNIILVRYLSLEDLGNYKIFFSVLNILIIFSINGLNTSVSRSAAKKYNRFFITATKISAIVSFLGTMIMIVLALTYYRGSGVKWPLLYACLFVPVYFGFNIWEAFYYGEKKFRLIFLTNLVLAVIRFGTCVSILYFLRNYVLTIVAYVGIVSGFNFIMFLRIYKRVKPEERDVPKEKELIKHGLKITGASTVSVIAKNIERLILDGVTSASMVGIYSIVSVFPTFIKNALKNLVNVPTVKLAAYSEKDNRRILKKMLVWIFIAGVVIVAVFWLITPFLLKFFFKQTDPKMFLYGRLLLIPLLFMPIDMTIKYMASYQGSGSSLFKLSVSTDIIKLASLAVFIPIYRIYGIITGQIVGEFLSFLTLSIWFLRTNKKFGIK